MVVYSAYCGGIFWVMWWYILRTVVVFLRNLVDKHYCGGFLCLMWWCFLHSVVDTHHCGELLCLMRWYFLRTVVDKHSCGGLLCLVGPETYKNIGIRPSPNQKANPGGGGSGYLI